MPKPLIQFSNVKSAVKTNQMFNYIPKNTNNNFTTYKEGDLQPSNIFPNGGVFNNINNHPNKYNPFIEGLPVDEYNAIGTNFNITKPFFNPENSQLPDLIKIGHQNSKISHIIGTSIYK